MRTLRIRKFMVLGMISVIIFPWFIYFVVHLSSTTTIPNGFWIQGHRGQSKLNDRMSMIVKNSAQWTNPSWQKKLRKQLSQDHMDVVILSPTNQQIFKTGFSHPGPWMTNQQVMVVNNGQIIGTVKLNTKWENDVAAGLIAIIALHFAIFFVGFQMRRSVVKPLEAMSRAARRIAEGDFDLKLPASRVTEIAEVRSGFEVMVAGLRDAFQKQAKLEEDRRFFIGAIAHDLRTPLFALRGYLDGLEQGIADSPDKMAKYVKVCKEKSNQLDRLVSDLFDFTKMEYMEQTPSSEMVDIELIVQRSIDSLRPLAEDKAVTIVEMPPNGKCDVTGDAHLLERALNNLLDNALRHTPQSGKIEVKWSHDYGKTKIEVKDTGPGFSPDELQHVFEPLYRGEASRNRATGGAGLGLTIAKRIFKAHGGDLTAGNHPTGGAVMTGWFEGQSTDNLTH